MNCILVYEMVKTEKKIKREQIKSIEKQNSNLFFLNDNRKRETKECKQRKKHTTQLSYEECFTERTH